MAFPCHQRICMAFWIGVGFAANSRAEETVKVFVLAGQSNMEGKAQNPLLEFQAVDEKTRDLFLHLRKGENWVVRDDVFIKFLDRSGPLTIGYGSPGRTGVEFEFGTVLGDFFGEPVLLVKAAWGGHSLVKQFRSPSAGLPAARIAEEWEKQQERVAKADAENGTRTAPPTVEDLQAEYGGSYRNMLAEVRNTRATYESLFPALKGHAWEIAGFVWFQGWNDQYDGAEAEYASNLRHFIDDVRLDLDAPHLPFVIGVMGQNGSSPATGPMLTIQQAQLAMNDDPHYGVDVRAVRTDQLVDRAAEQLYPTWKDDLEQWNRTGSDHPYHYLGSALWFQRMGHAFAEAMLELLSEQD